ncbi:hypothetical protein BpHYR1_008591 [Brachionus plicatilis]|uniref:Uncharacterized protein n=1 Tax=Brachionus plicatilis TaxID=10195 RepID=A0A3M7PM75_BRAPC|nr:hypothetical protein BpHYR1_008591 [Brachionus plicatilis]
MTEFSDLIIGSKKSKSDFLTKFYENQQNLRFFWHFWILHNLTDVGFAWFGGGKVRHKYVED